MMSGKPLPPKLACRFLRWFCPAHLVEGIEGDLEEQFQQDVISLGVRKARWRFARNVITFCQPGIVLRNKLSHPSTLIMLGNYTAVMWRGLKKRKFHSALNVFGLAAGLAFAFVVALFSWYQYSVNSSLTDADKLFLIESRSPDSDNNFPFFVPAPLAQAVATEYPTLVENYYRFWDRSITVSSGDKYFRISAMIGDRSLLTMFGFKSLYQSSGAAGELSVVITEKLARQYFDRADVVGETLTLSTELAGRKEYEIVAVIDDPPSFNTVTDLLNINAQIFLPLEAAKDFGLPDPAQWNSGQIISFLKLTGKDKAQRVEETLQRVLQENSNAAIAKNKVSLAPLTTYYIDANNGAIKKLILTLALVAVFILLLAVINFINLSIANAATRSKEIGIRKALGSARKQIAFQFVFESLLLTTAAFVFALTGYEALRTFFSQVFRFPLPGVLHIPGNFWLYCMIAVFSIGICAGAYPAIVLSSSVATDALKGKHTRGVAGLRFSRGLISMQYICALYVLILAVCIHQQVHYFLQRDLGYQKDAILTISSVPRIWNEEGLQRMEAAKAEFLQLPFVKEVSLSWEIPNGNYGNTIGLFRHDQDEKKALTLPLFSTDSEFAEAYGIGVLIGKFFSERPDNSEVVINEQASHVLGAKVGDQLRVAGSDDVVTVKGIVRDFNFFSLHQTMRPIAFRHINAVRVFRYFSLKLDGGNVQKQIEALHHQWKTIFPNEPFEYALLEDRLRQLYAVEQQLQDASSMAAILLLIIILAGVVGMISLVVRQRMKEIGIRKVLGASTVSVLALFSRQYLLLIVASIFFAGPIAYFSAQYWLNQYAYRIDIKVWMFAGPFAALVALTLLIVVFQSLRAALANPSTTLKYE